MKKTKVFAGRFFAAFLALLLLLLSVPTSSFAAPTIIDSGSCAKSGVMTWKLDSDGVLTIDGNGEMAYFGYQYDGITGLMDSATPWRKYYDEIKEIRITDNVTNISSYAFLGLNKAEKVYIGTGLEKVGGYAFLYCYSLKGVYITDLSAWCYIDFSASSNPLSFAHKLYLNGSLVQTLEIPIDNGEVKPYAFEGCNSIKTIVIPDSLLQIGGCAFSGCAFTAVSIPESVLVLSPKSFYGCYRLQSISVDEENEYYSSDSNGVLYNKDKSVLIKYPEAKANKTYTISSSVQTIGDWAFGGSDWLEDIHIPNSVDLICDYAFIGCSHLKNLYIYNPSCSFSLYSIAPTDYDGTVFHGYIDSTTEQFALVNNYRFETIGQTVTEPATNSSSEPSSEPTSAPNERPNEPVSETPATQQPINPTTESAVESITKKQHDEEKEQNLNFFQRIIQWFRNLFAKLFGKKN